MFKRWMQRCARPACLALLLAGSGGPAHAQEPPPAKSENTARGSFELEIEAPEAVRNLLQTHLELGRFKDQPDLTDAEIARLIELARKDSQQLLATQGFFSPSISLEREPAISPDTPARLLLRVEPGEPTRVTEVSIDFEGPIATDPKDRLQRESIREDWTLRPGDRFTQAAWDGAKQKALRELVRRRYATGTIGYSLADIDPETRSARLNIRLDSGPPFRIGDLIVQGADRYDANLAARLSQLVTGEDYDQSLLLEAQKKIGESGYFDSVFLSLDTNGSPEAAPLLVQVTEALKQKLVLGVGANTDVGIRLTAEHTHHLLPVLGWRAVSNLSLDEKKQFISTDLLAPPDEKNWRWLATAKIEREQQPSFLVSSVQLRGGQSKSTDRLDRKMYLLYDYATNDGTNAPPTASALSANLGWTWRAFKGLPFPTGGQGLSLEVGAGATLDADRWPFARAQARWQSYLPIGKAPSPAIATPDAGRLALRAELGAVVANANANLPTTLLFLTGGDNTVRGYAYESIGVTLSDGQTASGRYLAVGSVEWQRPITIDGRRSDWESAVFVDVGSVANTPSALKAKVGAGFGVIWNSPVGPLKADLAWGFADRKLRLVLAVGFKF